MKLQSGLVTIWPTVTLGALASLVQYGLTANAQGNTEGVLYLRISDIDDDGNAHVTEPKFVPASTHDLQKYILEPGDIVIARSGSVGRSYVYKGSEEPWVFASYLIRFRINPLLADADYLGFFLRSPYYWQYIESMSRAVAQPNINSKELSRLLIPLPPLPEQRRIVSILRQADELRRLRRVANERANDLLPALFHEMFGDPLTNDRGWEQKAIREMGKVTTGNTPPRKDVGNYGNFIEWIKSDNISETLDYVSQSKEYLSEEGAAKGRIAPEGSTLVTCIAGSHESIGKAALTDRDVAFNQQINAVIPFEDVNLFYLYAAIKFSKPKIQSLSAKGMKGIVNKSQLEGVMLSAPPYELQEEFAIRAVELFEVKDSQIEANKYCKALLQSLLAQAFSGELTSAWREQHADELAQAAMERDQLLDGLLADGQRNLFDADIVPRATLDDLDVVALTAQVSPAVDQLLAHAQPTSELITSLAQGAFGKLTEQMRTAAQIDTSVMDNIVSHGVLELARETQASLADKLQPILEARQAWETAVEPMRRIGTSIIENMQPIINAQQLLSQFAEPLREQFEVFRGFSVGLAEMLARAAEFAMRRPGSDHPRHHFFAEISDEQYRLYLLVSDETGYFTPESISERYTVPLESARAGLQLLAAAGFIISVSLPVSSTDAGTSYVAAFRVADDKDDVRLSDLAALEGPLT